MLVQILQTSVNISQDWPENSSLVDVISLFLLGSFPLKNIITFRSLGRIINDGSIYLLFHYTFMPVEKIASASDAFESLGRYLSIVLQINAKVLPENINREESLAPVDLMT